jgi:hypothetical protein
VNQAIGDWNYQGGLATHVMDYGQYFQHGTLPSSQLQQLLSVQQTQGAQMDGSKPIVVCGSTVENADDLDKAQKRAEELAHKQGANAYILKPIKMVVPKRDVVTTDLP